MMMFETLEPARPEAKLFRTPPEANKCPPFLFQPLCVRLLTQKNSNSGTT